MNPPTCRRYEKYACIKAKDVSEYLAKGFEPFGSAFYHIKEKCCYQAIVRYSNSTILSLPHLTGREKECLIELAKGFTKKRIAIELKCSGDNIKRIQKRLKEKFAVKTREALVQQARIMGII